MIQQRVVREDLADVTAGDQSITVTREQVAFRIRLAGIGQQLFRVDGAARVEVSVAAQPLTAQFLETIARRTVLERLAAQSEDLVIRLAKPIRVPALTAAPAQVWIAAMTL